MGEPQFIPDAQIAAITGRSRRTVRRWRHQGLLPDRRLGCVRGVLLSDLERLLGQLRCDSEISAQATLSSQINDSTDQIDTDPS